MRRREFIAGLCGGAVAFSQAAPAQEQSHVRRIGLLMASAETDPDGQARTQAFRGRLQELSWVEGRNLQLDWRWAAGDTARFQTYAAELVALAPDLLLADATPSVAAPLHETKTIPIIFCRVGDAVGSGFVESLARPGGNATGFTAFEPPMGLKWLELLKEAAPAYPCCPPLQPQDGSARRVVPSLNSGCCVIARDRRSAGTHSERHRDQAGDQRGCPSQWWARSHAGHLSGRSS